MTLLLLRAAIIGERKQHLRVFVESWTVELDHVDRIERQLTWGDQSSGALVVLLSSMTFDGGPKPILP